MTFYLILLIISMLKYQSSAHRNTLSSPQIDSMFLLTKLTTATLSPHIKTQKDQISQIRNMGKLLFDQQFGSEVTFDEKYNDNAQIQNNKGKRSQYKVDLYERGKVSEHKKWQKIVENNKKQIKKVESLANTSRNTLNKTAITIDNKLRTNQLHLQTPRKKQSYMIKQVLKKCIKEEQQIYQIKQQEKHLNYSKTNMYLKNSNYQQESKKNKKVATKEELKKIFDQVNKRGDQLKKRKQIKIQKYQEQKKHKEMEGVTFYPQFQSMNSLRKNCTKGFLQRLKQDDYHREKQKVQILATELKKDPFQPKLNTVRNSLSKSKIDSFRLQDSIFFTHRHRAEQQFQKSLSRFIFPQQEQQYKQSRNNSLQIAINSKDLNFLFQ